MERTADGMELLEEAIRPPGLEDAGLENCALPPEAIKEAFLKAAEFVKSRVVADEDEEGGGCVGDGGPSNGEIPDVLVGADEVPEEETLCGGVREKLAFPTGKEQGLVDDVVVVGSGNGVASDDVVVVLGGGEEGGGGKACVGEGVWDGEKKKSRGEEEDGGNEEGELTLAAVLI